MGTYLIERKEELLKYKASGNPNITAPNKWFLKHTLFDLVSSASILLNRWWPPSNLASDKMAWTLCSSCNFVPNHAASEAENVFSTGLKPSLLQEIGQNNRARLSLPVLHSSVIVWYHFRFYLLPDSDIVRVETSTTNDIYFSIFIYFIITFKYRLLSDFFSRARSNPEPSESDLDYRIRQKLLHG